ncbi:MAG: MlaD family protein [Gemmatimonadales bacterium]|jgi:phospholipid/cholesterol/gamma-HCH transport system substrate-binding protein
MDLYYKQELTVGALVLVALATFIGGLMWLTGKSFTSRGKATVSVQFGVVSGLTTGDPVQISGVNVGRVSGVRLEEVDRAIVHLEVDSRFRPRADAEAQIRSLDFLGAKYVSYTPGEAEEFLPDDAIIVGVEEHELASTAAQLAEEAGEVLRRSQNLLSDSMAIQVQRTLVAAERALDVVARVGSGPMVESATETLVSLQGAARSLDSLLGNPALDESISQMDEIAESVQEMADGLAAVTQNLAMMLELMQSPDGSIGRALTDTTLHTDVHELLVSMRLLLDDIRERPGRYVNVTVF